MNRAPRGEFSPRSSRRHARRRGSRRLAHGDSRGGRSRARRVRRRAHARTIGSSTPPPRPLARRWLRRRGDPPRDRDHGLLQLREPACRWSRRRARALITPWISAWSRFALSSGFVSRRPVRFTRSNPPRAADARHERHDERRRVDSARAPAVPQVRRVSDLQPASSGRGTKAQLAKELVLSKQEVESVIGIVRSRPDSSVDRLFRG